MNPKLSLRRIGKRFGDLEALRDIDVAISRGEFIALVGPSGCGKTTLLRIVAGLEPATRGEVLHRRQRRHRSRAATAASCSRQYNLLPWRNVLAQRGNRPSRSGAGGTTRQRRTPRPAASWSGLEGFESYLPAPALRRHAAARQPRPRARHRSRYPADGRAVRGARPANPRDHADRACALGRRGRKTVLFVTHRSTKPSSCRTACCVLGAPARPRAGDLRSTCRGRARSRSSARREFVAYVDRIWRLIEDDVRASVIEERA